MIIGFKGESSKLKNLYKELGLNEVKPSTLEELESAIKANDGSTVIANYNDLMVYDNATADIVEKKNKIMKVIKGQKKKLYLGLTKDDPSLDKVKLDVSVCTNVSTKDMTEIQNLYSFLNTDLAYSGKLSDDEYAVKASGSMRAEKMSLTALKKVIK